MASDFTVNYENVSITVGMKIGRIISRKDVYGNGSFELVVGNIKAIRLGKKKNTVARIRLVSELTPALCQAFADYLRTTALAVDSHNRKINRLRKIFE